MNSIFKKSSGLLLFLFFSFQIGAQMLVPPSNKTMLVIGQDLLSVHEYANSGYFPVPGGVTSYINLYDVADADAVFPFGGLGEKLDGTTAPDIDWGAGPLNTKNSGYGYPNSTLSIGVYMTEEFYPNGLSKIANGDYDVAINRLATFLKDLDQPVFLRIGYEFDGNWNVGYDNTTNFINAYKHIVDVIRPQAPKCMMVWQACTSPVDDLYEKKTEDITDWYPGDNYVDYMGYSWFLPTQKQIDLADELVNFARQKGKPVMCCEAAPQGYDISELNRKNINDILDGAPATGEVAKTASELWNEWFKPFFDYIHANDDVIRIVSYINADWDSQKKWGPDSKYKEGYWGDSRVEANADIKDMWLNEINNDFWLHGSDQLFAELSDGSTIENENPVVSFQSPSFGAEWLYDETYEVTISASDNGEIASVELYLDDELVGAKTTAPYTWNIVADLELTSHTLKAIAKDNENNETEKETTVSVNGPNSVSDPVELFDVPQGKTLVMIGQTYTQEYKDYVTAMGKAPAGSSHYAELYSGTINQGDDGNNEAFLSYISTNYPNSFAELAISIKDNAVKGGGYENEPDATWQACRDINLGLWDDEIDAIAQSLKAKPNIRFFLRLGYEVSLNMMANKTTTPFIEILNKYADQGINPLERADEVTEFDLAAYKDAYNYMAERIRVHNAVTNVRFVYHPVRGINDAQQLYPGDEWVDYFALSLFNHDVCVSTWENGKEFPNCEEAKAMDDNVKKCLDWARDVIKKPIIIGEAAAQSHVTEQTSAAHMNAYLDKVFNIINTYDVKALVYINSDWGSHGWSDQWGDSRVQKDAAVLSHWQEEVLKERYIHYPDEIVNLSETKDDNYVAVWPNPSHHSFNLRTEVECDYVLYNNLGMVVESGKCNGTTSIGNGLQKGSYILKLSGGVNKTIQIVKL